MAGLGRAGASAGRGGLDLAEPAPVSPAARSDILGSAGVLGERVFLRARDQIAAHHLRVAYTLTTISALGAIPLIWGLYALDIRAALCGGVLVAGAKTWFVDRMVWVWQDYQRAGGGLSGLGAQG